MRIDQFPLRVIMVIQKIIDMIYKDLRLRQPIPIVYHSILLIPFLVSMWLFITFLGTWLKALSVFFFFPLLMYSISPLQSSTRRLFLNCW